MTRNLKAEPGNRLEIVDLRRSIRLYLVSAFMLHLVWEVLQLPLYTIWQTGSTAALAWAVLHCTIGDVMIAGFVLLIAFVSVGRSWPAHGSRAVWVVALVLGLVYTAYSEWLNVHVRGNWAYSTLMPRLPVLGTGLAPILQWITIPTLVLWICVGRAPWLENELHEEQPANR